MNQNTNRPKPVEQGKISVRQLVDDFNRSALRRKMIPAGMTAGWPCIQNIGKTLCLTIPFYSCQLEDRRAALYPIYCSVTFPVRNPDRLLDFTIYPHQETWSDVDYQHPAGYFKHKALEDVATKGEYTALVDQLYAHYDGLVSAVENRIQYADEKAMITLFSKLMEPGLFPFYCRIRQKFYTHFCRI